MPILSSIAAATARAYGFFANLFVEPDPYFEYVSLLAPGNGTNGAQNNTFIDSSSNGYTVTRQGNTTQGSFGPYGKDSGYWSIFFDGSTDAINLGSTVFDSMPTTFTFEGWVFPTKRGPNAIEYYNTSIFGKGATYMNWGLNSSGNLQLYHYDGTPRFPTSSGTVPLNTWTHVATVVNSSAITFYINGVASGTGTWYGIAGANGTQGTFGYTEDGNAGTDRYFGGFISNARYTNAAVYTTGFTPSTTPLANNAASTNSTLLLAQANRFVDASVSPITISSFSGTPEVKAFSPFNPLLPYSSSSDGGSGYWDGTGDYLELAQNAAWRFGSGDFTIESYVYIDNPTNDMTQNLAFHWNGTTNGDVTGSTNVLSNSWNHVAVTRTGTTLRFWINGVQDSGGAQTVSSVIYNNNDPLMIGRGADHTTASGRDICHCGETGGAANKWFFYLRNGGAGDFKGYMAGFRISNSVRYTATFTPPSLPMASDGNTSLLLNFINGSIFDAAAINDIETVGNAQISTTQSRFDGSSMYFDGNGDYLVMPDVTTGQFRTGDFTVEYWDYHGTQGTNFGDQVGTVSSGTPNFTWRFGTFSNTAGLTLAVHNGSAYTDYTFSDGTVYNDSTWRHFALTRQNGSVRCFVNGVQIGSTQTVTLDFSSSNRVIVGAELVTPSYFTGYISNLRITKGYARYTANFTPPTAPFPTY